MRKFTLGRWQIHNMTFKDVHVPTQLRDHARATREDRQAAGITIMGGGTITMQNDAAQIWKDFVYAKDAGMPLIYASPDPAVPPDPAMRR